MREKHSSLSTITWVGAQINMNFISTIQALCRGIEKVSIHPSDSQKDVSTLKEDNVIY